MQEIFTAEYIPRFDCTFFECDKFKVGLITDQENRNKAKDDRYCSGLVIAYLNGQSDNDKGKLDEVGPFIEKRTKLRRNTSITGELAIHTVDNIGDLQYDSG